MYEVTVAACLGIFFGVVTAVAGRSMKPRTELRFFTVVLVLAALLFIGFPAEAGDRLGIVTESVAAAGFLVLAGLGMVVHPIWLVVGFLFHASWDLAYLVDVVRSTKPDWTVEFCVPYDLVVAGYAATRLRRWRPRPEPAQVAPEDQEGASVPGTVEPEPQGEAGREPTDPAPEG